MTPTNDSEYGAFAIVFVRNCKGFLMEIYNQFKEKMHLKEIRRNV